jgi:hypothetical protein
MSAKKDAKPLNESAKQAQADGGIYLDPDLAKLRDEEAKRLGAVEVVERPEPTITPEAEAARNADLARLNEDGTVKVADQPL